ncbi:MAG: zinc-dependent alcohol dehydrogenase [bacterium]
MSGVTSHTIYFTGPKSVELRTEQCTPGSDEVVLESELIGVSCGTELLLYRNEFPPGVSEDGLSGIPQQLEYPVAYGYMNVAHDAQGRRYFAFAVHSDRFSAAADSLIPIGDLPADDAVFTASMETALGIVQDARPLPGDHILVTGQGVVGLLVTELLVAQGLLTVYTAEPAPSRRRAAEATGASLLPVDTQQARARLLEETDARGVDLAINVSGSAQAMQFAIDNLAFEGRLIEASWFGNKASQLQLGRNFHRKRLTIEASQVSNVAGSFMRRWSKTRRMQYVLDLLRRVRPGRYITHRFSMTDCGSAFRLLDRGEDGVLQPVFVPGGATETST